jgi:hypothetical protein
MSEVSRLPNMYPVTFWLTWTQSGLIDVRDELHVTG